MRASFYASRLHALVLLFGVALLSDPAQAQSSSPTFRAATWGMPLSTVQSAEPGTRIGSRPDPAPGLDHVEAYVDVVHGKTGEVAYGFSGGRLVYGAYRFTLKERDRPFSEATGRRLRSSYGETERVEVSGNGHVLHLHWSTPHTKVIARFAPKSLRIDFWAKRHWSRHVRRPAPTDSPDG